MRFDALLKQPTLANGRCDKRLITQWAASAKESLKKASRSRVALVRQGHVANFADDVVSRFSGLVEVELSEGLHFRAASQSRLVDVDENLTCQRLVLLDCCLRRHNCNAVCIFAGDTNSFEAISVL